MFDELIREAGRLEAGIEIPVSITLDPEGYGDRMCPNEHCQFAFKVKWSDWREKVSDDSVYCPSCRPVAESICWNTPEQANHFKRSALSAIGQRLGLAMERDAERWNRQQPAGGFISVSLSVETPSRAVLLPPPAADSMRLKTTCSRCSCEYAVIGAAFLCPACGHNDVDRVFGDALDNVCRTLDVVPSIRGALPTREDEENTTRSLIEHSLQSSVTAFQKYAEHLYARLATPRTLRRNTFQSIDEGSGVWEEATAKGYRAYLKDAELAVLRRGFQQRHLLAHTPGIVDRDYIARSGDATWSGWAAPRPSCGNGPAVCAATKETRRRDGERRLLNDLIAFCGPFYPSSRLLHRPL